MAYLIVSETPVATGGHNSPTLLEGQYLGRTPPAGRKVNFVCTEGCPLPAPVCHDVLRTAILDAIDLASNADSKLNVNPREQGALNAFAEFFGHNPSVTWAPNIQAGAIVARRFRKVAAALRRWDTRYRCVSTCPSRCDPPDPMVVCDLNLNALAILCENEVQLCPPFWQLPPFLKAGVILHETFHLCFGLTCAWFQHDSKERKRNSAYCYQAFALRVKGHNPDLTTLNECKAVKP